MDNVRGGRANAIWKATVWDYTVNINEKIGHEHYIAQKERVFSLAACAFFITNIEFKWSQLS